MRASNSIQNKIKGFEGLRLTGYYDEAGIYTIGYGHTLNAKAYRTINQQQADNLFNADILRFESLLNRYIRERRYQLNQNQFDALLSFVFNLGSIKAGSNLDKAIRNSDNAKVAEYLNKYVFANGVRLQGLANRRIVEASIYNSFSFNASSLIFIAIPVYLFALKK